MAALINKFRQTDQGAELIEMAIVTPLLLMLLFGLIDFGFLFKEYVVLTNAAAEGARVASLPGYGPSDVSARVAAYATSGGIKGSVSTSTSAVTLPGSGGASWPGSKVTVTHVYSYQFIGPIAALFGGSPLSSVTMTSTSTVRNMVGGAPGS